MFPLPLPGPPPPPAPSEHPVARRCFSQDRSQREREGRKRAAEGTRLVELIRPSSPMGLVEGSLGMEEKMFTWGGLSKGRGWSLTSRQRVEPDVLLVCEVEELKARLVQMENTLKLVESTDMDIFLIILYSGGGVTVLLTGGTSGQR